MLVNNNVVLSAPMVIKKRETYAEKCSFAVKMNELRGFNFNKRGKK